MHHNNFEVGKRYERLDGVIITIVKRWQYTDSTTKDTAALVTGDDGYERWDDPNPGFGVCTGAVINSISPFAIIPDPVLHNLKLGEIPAGRTNSGPLKIR